MSEEAAVEFEEQPAPIEYEHAFLAALDRLKLERDTLTRRLATAEQERDELCKALSGEKNLDAAYASVAAWQEDTFRLERERDEARRSVDQLQDELVMMVESLTKDRDEARAEKKALLAAYARLVERIRLASPASMVALTEADLDVALSIDTPEGSGT